MSLTAGPTIADVIRDIERQPTELTALHLRILGYLADGYTVADVGRILGLTEDAAKYRCLQLRNRLGAGDYAEAVARAYRRGLLS